MNTVLFHGDSITDAGRYRDDPNDLGYGYARVVAGKLGFEFPNQYKFYNRGIGGYKIIDIYAGIKADIINLKPDYLSLLVGVNDAGY